MDTISIFSFVLSILSGIVGAVLALLGQHIVSKRTSETEMKKVILTSYLPARLKAYTDYISALNTWAEKLDESSCHGMFHAANIVSLVASEQTIQALSTVQGFVFSFQETGISPFGNKFDQAKLSLLISMHNDLMRYPNPTYQRKVKNTHELNKDKK